ncbi:MAG: hypothetical protein WC421_04820 [Elusimicrobiales bacterium]
MSGPADIKFGTDGWRGIIAWDFTFDNVRRAAQAIADYARASSPVPLESQNLIVVGYDRRFLSEQFAREIARVISANKLGVTLLDAPSPSPEISFLTLKKFWLGVMVTASHNPFHYNGIKLKIAGHSAPEALTKAVEAQLGKIAPQTKGHSPLPERSFRNLYEASLAARVDGKAVAQGLKAPVVIDYMHGSAAGIVENLVKTKKLIAIRAAHDPMFSNTHPEPVAKHLGALCKAVADNKAIAGLALDGDGDRIGMVDEAGRFITPPQMMALFLWYLAEVKKLKGTVVQSVSQGFLSKRIARANGLPLEETPVGFKYLAERLEKGGVLLAGEESGGFAWKGCPPERDGSLCALLALEMLVKTGKKPSVLLGELEKKHGKSVFERRDRRIQKIVADKAVFAEKLKKRLPKKLLGKSIAQAETTDGLKIILENDWWALLRPSGTEPLMRIYAETDSPKSTEELIEYSAKLGAAHI